MYYEEPAGKSLGILHVSGWTMTLSGKRKTILGKCWANVVEAICKGKHVYLRRD